MNAAYVTLMTKDRFLPGVLILNESLRMAGCQYPLKCMITEGLSYETLNILNKAGIETMFVEKIPLPESIQKSNMELDANLAMNWEDCLTKLHVFSMMAFDKIIFCDADLMVLKNLDHCFEYPHMTAALDGEYSGLWPTWPHFNSGFMVIEPQLKAKDDIIAFANSLNPKEVYDPLGHNYTIADQEILNLYFDKWVEKTDLHLNKYYNIFAPHTPASKNEDVLHNAYFIHYVGQKPWLYPNPYRDTTGYKSLFLYCLALGLYNIIVKNNYEPIDWSTIGDKLNEAIFIASVDELYDLPTAEYFLQTLVNNPNYASYRNVVANNEKCEFFAPILKKIVNGLREEGEANCPDFTYNSWNFILSNLQYSEYRGEVVKVWESLKSIICR